MISLPFSAYLRIALVLLVQGITVRAAQQFTIHIPPQPVPVMTTNTLVSHGANWHWRRGTTAPQTDWRGAAVGNLDGTWTEAPGGFGYGDNAIVGEATRVNPGMVNVHSTLYLRQAFTVTDVDARANLILTVDYDDGFVAYLDGVEVARRNVPGASGSPVANTATTGGTSHEASCCNSPNPAVPINLGAVGNRLPTGDHVLAVIGVNQSVDSSDFHIIVDLAAIVSEQLGDAPDLVDRGLYAFTTNASVTFQGINTLNGSTRVTVDGDEVAMTGGDWSVTRTLQPGFNRLYFAAHNAAGNIVTNLTQDVVYQASFISAGGILNGTHRWEGPQVIYLTNDVTIPGGARLEIGPGAIIMLPPDTSITATTDGTIDVQGTEGNHALFLPQTTNEWGWLMADGENAILNLSFAEVVAGQLRLLDGASALIEDSVLRDMTDEGREMIAAVEGAELILRRCYMTRFTEGDSRDTPVLVEGCLLEGFLIDGLDIKAEVAPLIVRRSTFRYADPTNLNADAIDFGPGAGTVESCLMHHFPDKGVSIGGAPGTTIRDSVIFRCGIGVSAYSSSGLTLLNTTIVDCNTGILFRNNPTPGVGTGTNLIVWGNTTNVSVINTSSLGLFFSDIDGTNFPGTGNISADPLFVDPSARDYRLTPNSPAIGTGLGGSNMGAPYPVGGIPSPPDRLVARATTNGQVELNWIDTSDNEDGNVVQRSSNGTAWQTIGATATQSLTWTDIAPVTNQKTYYRVRATNDVGVSFYSNRAAVEVPGAIQLTIIHFSETEVVLSFSAAAGQAYRLQSRTNLTAASWDAGLPFSASTNTLLHVTNSIPGPERYFRLVSP